MVHSERIGAWFGPSGCDFRLWAPHASTVSSSSKIVSSELIRSDPSSNNGSVLLDWDAFAWATFYPPRFEDYLIYQFHVGSFAGRGDEQETDWSTFRDVETKLAYIRELGFDCIELLPIHEFAMDRSWGYNPASFFAPESSYGSPRDLRHLVDTAHREGLAVIFDVVYNHAGPGDNVLWAYDGFSGRRHLLRRRATHPVGPRPSLVEKGSAGVFLSKRADVP